MATAIQERQLGFSTRKLHAGYSPDPTTESRAVQLYQTTSYQFKSTEHAANLFALKELGNIYTRLNNPTTDVFEKRFATLEGGAGGLATSSGMAAIFYAIANAAEAGDNIICARQLYGGTLTQASYTLKRFGISARYFDVQNPSEIE